MFKMKFMSGIQDHVPLSIDRIKDLAKVMGISHELMWINPVTGAMGIRDLAELKVNNENQVASNEVEGYTSEQ